MKRCKCAILVGRRAAGLLLYVRAYTPWVGARKLRPGHIGLFFGIPIVLVDDSVGLDYAVVFGETCICAYCVIAKSVRPRLDRLLLLKEGESPGLKSLE